MWAGQTVLACGSVSAASPHACLPACPQELVFEDAHDLLMEQVGRGRRAGRAHALPNRMSRVRCMSVRWRRAGGCSTPPEAAGSSCPPVHHCCLACACT